MSAGASNRATAATGMNEGSSRSHSVFTVTVTQKDSSNGTSKSGKLVLVVMIFQKYIYIHHLTLFSLVNTISPFPNRIWLVLRWFAKLTHLASS